MEDLDSTAPLSTPPETATPIGSAAGTAVHARGVLRGELRD